MTDTPIPTAKPAITPTPIIDANIGESAAELESAAINVWDTFIKALSSADGYIELLCIGIATFTGIGLALLLRWLIIRYLKKTADMESWEWMLKPTRLLLPLFTIMALSLVEPIIAHHTKVSVFFTPTTQIATAWLLIYAVHMLIASRLMAWFLSILIATLIGLQSFGLLGPITRLLSDIGMTVGNIEITLLGVIQGIVICILVFWLARMTASRAEKQLRSSRLSYNIRELIIKLIKMLVYFIALVLTLSAMGVDLTAFAVFGGALGVGIGLGLQKITANFVSGITLLMERSVRQGDLIQVNGIHGYVRELNIRYTLVETFGGQEVSIPNETLTSNNIINWTMSNARARIEVPVSIAYGSDYRLAQKLIIQAAHAHPRTLKDPETVCVIREFGNSSVNFLLQFWVGNVVDGLYPVQSEVMFNILELFAAHGITIPYAQHDVRIIDTGSHTKAADA